MQTPSQGWMFRKELIIFPDMKITTKISLASGRV